VKQAGVRGCGGYRAAVDRSRDWYARLLRGVGSLLLVVGGLVLVLASVTWGREGGQVSSGDLATGLVALVVGVLAGLPLVLERLRR
jgi:hypothetical protein